MLLISSVTVGSGGAASVEFTNLTLTNGFYLQFCGNNVNNTSSNLQILVNGTALDADSLLEFDNTNFDGLSAAPWNIAQSGDGMNSGFTAMGTSTNLYGHSFGGSSSNVFDLRGSKDLRSYSPITSLGLQSPQNIAEHSIVSIYAL